MYIYLYSIYTYIYTIFYPSINLSIYLSIYLLFEEVSKCVHTRVRGEEGRLGFSCFPNVFRTDGLIQRSGGNGRKKTSKNIYFQTKVLHLTESRWFKMLFWCVNDWKNRTAVWDLVLRIAVINRMTDFHKNTFC